MRQEFITKLGKARAELTAAQERDLVLRLAKDDVAIHPERVRHRPPPADHRRPGELVGQVRRPAAADRGGARRRRQQAGLSSSRTSAMSDVPRGWVRRRLMDLVRIPNGQVDPRAEPYRSQILIAPDHIASASGCITHRETAMSQGAISGKYQIFPGDVLYSKDQASVAQSGTL